MQTAEAASSSRNHHRTRVERIHTERCSLLAGISRSSGITGCDPRAQFVNRRLGLQPDVATVELLLARPEVQSELKQPIGKRVHLAKIVDDFGMRSFRIEIEETVT